MFDETAMKLKELNGTVLSASAIQSVDLLTEPEIEMLRELGSMTVGPETDDYIGKVAADEALKGRYVQLSELGFIYGNEYLGGNLGYHGLSAKAGWAVDRYDRAVKRKQEEELELKRLRRSDRAFNIETLVLGWALGILSAWICGQIMP